MKLRDYLTESSKEIIEIMPKLEYLKISNMTNKAGSWMKAEVKTKDGSFMSFDKNSIEKLLKELYKRIKEY